jgi:hypothetical protein
MNRLAAGVVAGPLLFQAISGMGLQSGSLAAAQRPSACKPSPTVLHAAVAPVPGLTPQQIQNATAIINAATQLRVPERGQTIAVMAALEASSLTNPPADQAQGTGPSGLFGQGTDQEPEASRLDPTASAQHFYRALVEVKGWQNMPPTLAAHAAQRNLDPEVYARWWPQAVTVVNALTTGSGVAGLQNLAARAQAVADCAAATVRGRFAVNGGTHYVGPFAPTVLDSRALGFAQHGGSGWFERCQAFVAILDGRPYSGYTTALDAWQTFEATGAAHPVTSTDGVAPPVGAWLYYRDSTNPAGHVVTYLGNGQIASTDVFGEGRVGIGPASAITNGPWRMQYLGWAAPWGSQ